MGKGQIRAHTGLDEIGSSTKNMECVWDKQNCTCG